jgi:hypothetical protein
MPLSDIGNPKPTKANAKATKLGGGSVIKMLKVAILAAQQELASVPLLLAKMTQKQAVYASD